MGSRSTPFFLWAGAASLDLERVLRLAKGLDPTHGQAVSLRRKMAWEPWRPTLDLEFRSNPWCRLEILIALNCEPFELLYITGWVGSNLVDQ